MIYVMITTKWVYHDVCKYWCGEHIVTHNCSIEKVIEQFPKINHFHLLEEATQYADTLSDLIKQNNYTEKSTYDYVY